MALPSVEAENFIFQQDGAPPHWHNEVRGWLNGTAPERLIGLRRQDLLSMAFTFTRPNVILGFTKDRMYVPPLPADMFELRNRIEAAVATITEYTYQRLGRTRPCDKWWSH